MFNRQNKRDAECFCKKMQTHEPLTCLCTHNLYDSSCTMLLIIMYPLSLSPLKTKRPNNPTSIIHPFPPCFTTKTSFSTHKNRQRHAASRLASSAVFDHVPARFATHRSANDQRLPEIHGISPPPLGSQFLSGRRRWSNSSAKKKHKQTKKHSFIIFILLS